MRNLRITKRRGSLTFESGWFYPFEISFLSLKKKKKWKEKPTEWCVIYLFTEYYLSELSFSTWIEWRILRSNCFSQPSRARGNSINDRGERVVINHPYRYYTGATRKSKVIYELISALARMLTKRVSVCLSCNATSWPRVASVRSARASSHGLTRDARYRM